MEHQPALPADCRIEAATPGNVPLILRLVKALAEYERLGHEVVATEQSLREALFGDRPVTEAAIAYAGGEGVGMAIWFQNYSTFLGQPGIYLEDVFVLPEWRGRGIGRAMLAHLARLALARGCGRLEWSVLNWNTPAVEFYRSLGAQPLDGWTVYRLTGDALDRVAHM